MPIKTPIGRYSVRKWLKKVKKGHWSLKKTLKFFGCHEIRTHDHQITGLEKWQKVYPLGHAVLHKKEANPSYLYFLGLKASI